MRQIHAAALALAGLFAAAPPAMAQAQDFYRGKTINFIIGYGPGGGVDSASRLIVRHLSRFIPGKPDITPQNMEGAGGVIAGNHLGRRATADGLTIGLPGRSWFVEGMVKSPGVIFEPIKFSYIGSTGVNNTLLYMRGDLNIATPEALKAYPQKIPAAGIGAGTSTVTIPNMLAEYGYPLRTVLGYNSSARALMALEQGEVGAYFTPEDSFSKRPDLVEKRVVVPILQSKRMVAGMPVLADLVPAKDQAVLSLFTAYDDTGLMVVGPPGVPTDRLEILRKAFFEMCNDTDFHRDAATAGEPVGAPIPGPELEKTIARLAEAATPEVISEYRRLGQAK
jgi:tripartite-type tricarboxylate transporter receptor subunit TctC